MTVRDLPGLDNRRLGSGGIGYFGQVRKDIINWKTKDVVTERVLVSLGDCRGKGKTELENRESENQILLWTIDKLRKDRD